MKNIGIGVLQLARLPEGSNRRFWNFFIFSLQGCSIHKTLMFAFEPMANGAKRACGFRKLYFSWIFAYCVYEAIKAYFDHQCSTFAL